MAKVNVLAGDKGGSGKTTNSHAIAHGLAMHGVRAFHISTDPRREILPSEVRRYATLDGRNPTTLGALAALAAALQSQGVPTSVRTVTGTTHDFFGLGGSVPEAAAAEDHAAQTLKIALTRTLPPIISPPRARRARR